MKTNNIKKYYYYTYKNEINFRSETPCEYTCNGFARVYTKVKGKVQFFKNCGLH